MGQFGFTSISGTTGFVVDFFLLLPQIKFLSLVEFYLFIYFLLVQIIIKLLFLGLKSGDYEEIRDRMYTKILNNGSLLLQNVKEDREGYYLCQAQNGIGNGIGKVLQLKVNCKYFIILNILKIKNSFDNHILKKKYQNIK